MKFRITFEIDAKGTSYSIANKKDEASTVLSNLGRWLYELHLGFLAKRADRECNKNPNPAFQAAIMRHIKDDLKLSEQLFNNYTVEGETEDGQKFTFTHQDPGYKETMTWHEGK